ncbi:MAG: hypothetical protein QG656_2688 [Candidatus Hydrogenedentes bacterium]|nr:hypothetical protein [Candidatus Hydrogenedentota bacterium]
MAAFDGWAEYYDLIHAGLPGEAEFYVGQAVRLGAKTLELGCGTGRIAIPMAMSGVDVVGLDNSEPMLECCREKLSAVEPVPGTLRTVCADMTDFDLNERFDLIVMAYRTFMHLLTQRDQRRCLMAVRHHLADDGVFILNVWVPKPSRIVTGVAGPAASAMRLAGRHPIPETGETVVHRQSARCDEFRQLIEDDRLFQVLDKKGSITEEARLPMVRTWITPREMDNLVRLCGFDVEACFGDFDCNALGENSDEAIWVLRKRT